VDTRKDIYPHKKRLVESYREWLAALNYEPKSLINGPKKISEFLGWLADNGITDLNKPNQPNQPNQLGGSPTAFFNWLSSRPNKRTGRALSLNYLKSYHREIKRFSRYLQETGKVSFVVAELDKKLVNSFFSIEKEKCRAFTKQEIERLYEACSDDLVGLRDRAMLSVYYGCGLRRSEAASLLLNDVDLERRQLRVRKGKNYKQRYVPIAFGVARDVKNYLEYSRKSMETNDTNNQLFIGMYGREMEAQSLADRLKILKTKAKIKTPGGLHALRHSIATHLLNQGMSLEQIATFLGHGSLESTQIYTTVEL
jgi:site-specific recombinase XerD